VTTRSVRRWLAWGLLATVFASLMIWERTRERWPEQIRIATASAGGLYYRFGTLLAREIERRTPSKVEVIETEGSLANAALLREGRVDLALLQLGTVEADGIAALAPLYRDVVHVIVRPDRGLDSIAALDRRAIVLGPHDSGMRATAERLLSHYGVKVIPETSERYFMELASDPTLDGAIVTSGSANPDLEALLASRRFRLLPLLQAEAIAERHTLLTQAHIPMGRFSSRPPVPEVRIPTVAIVNVLAARSDASEQIVTAALSALYEGYLGPEVPGLYSRAEAARWEAFPLHSAARAYHDPYQSIGLLANLFETLAAIKELLFALGAGLYLAFGYWQTLERREVEAELSRQKEHLDLFLERTVAIERAQVGVHDREMLSGLLDQLTDIKLAALEELTGEEVRGDQMFAIFLTQCSTVSRKLEAKLQSVSLGAGAPRRSPSDV